MSRRASSDGDAAARELNDLRLVFANISGYKKQVGLRTIIKLPELKAQIAEGDVRVEDLESIWLEACAVEGVTAVDPGDDAGAKDTERGSWGVCTELPFKGFLHFLTLCEGRVSFPKDMVAPLDASPRSAKIGHSLVAARHRMVGLLRATLTLHQRGGAGEEREKDHRKDQSAQLGEILHSNMVRAALEEGLTHHTPETLRELMRTGVYKESNSEDRLEREEKKACLGLNLGKQMSHDELVRSGLLRETPPDELAPERASTRDHVQHPQEEHSHPRVLAENKNGTGLNPQERRVERAFLTGKLKHDLAHREGFEVLKQKGIALDMAPGEAHEQHLRAAAKVSLWLRSRPSPEEMRAWHIVHTPKGDTLRQAEIDSAKSMLEDMYGGGQELPSATDKGAGVQGHHHHRRPSLDELKARGIYRTPEELQAEERQHKQAGDFLQQELGHRADISELKERGIYLSQAGEARHRLERSMVSDQLSKSLKERVYIEELMDRGVLESSQLIGALKELEKKGPVETIDDVLKWPILASAVKEGVVGMETLRKAFDAAKDAGGWQRMGYEQFDKFLSSTLTTLVEEEPYSLKLWALMRMTPELEEQEHREGNRRRNALMAQELEQELGKREPLERLANKGIYLDKTPTEGAVERAHLTHTLAHGLAHRPDLVELFHKGVYLEGIEAGNLEKAHRDARNSLEGALSRRPTLSALKEKGYLEADELEEAFAELVLEYKQDSTTSTIATSAATGSTIGNSNCRLLLPADRLAAWAPVQKMLKSGAAIEEDVTAALEKAQKASFHGRERGGDGAGGQGSNVDFVGFLEFIHSLDVEVDGLDAAGQSAANHEDQGEGDRHMRRLHMRRQRAAHAAEEDSYGTLKEHLLAHLRARPAKYAPETQRIAKEFHTAKAVELEKTVVKDRLEGHLRARAESAEASADNANASLGRTLGDGGERAARIKELEFAMNKRMLMHSLARRPSGEVLLNKGILHTQTPQQEKLQRLVASDHVKHSLETRPSLGEATEAGVYRGSGAGAAAKHVTAASTVARGLGARPSHQETVVSRRALGSFVSSLPPSPSERMVSKDKRGFVGESLEHPRGRDGLTDKDIFQSTMPSQYKKNRHLVEERLSKSLRNPRRPSKRDLVEHGLYIDSTPRELQMEHYLASRNLKHALEGRKMQDLKDHGIFQAEDSKRTAHEKLLVKALLQRKLSHAFSHEELARLKQKGIYKEEDHQKVAAERLLVTRQLTRLVGRRPDPAQLEREHPGLMEASTLALVFEERVMPRIRGGSGREGEEADVESNGGPEHLVSFEGLMTWPDVQEHLTGENGKDVENEMAQHFELCDADGDGFITFSQFLRWVELCDLNPEDHLQVTDSDLDAEYARLGGTIDKGVTLDDAMACRLVQRWSTSASLDREALEIMWGSRATGSWKAKGFKAFCRHCESRSSAAHQERLAAIQVAASAEEKKGKTKLRSKLAAKLIARPDLEELKKARIYRQDGLDPATEHLERNLIAVSLKEQLLARPALEDLERRGIKPKDGAKAQLERNSLKLREALDKTMQHDDAQWRSHPSQLGAGPREEVSALLQKSLSKRLSMQQLTNKGIYVIDTDANYALLVHQVLLTHQGFTMSLAQLAASL